MGTRVSYAAEIKRCSCRICANAYVGLVEWWLKNGMPYPPKEMAKKVGDLLERII
jgi:hypothetical protein